MKFGQPIVYGGANRRCNAPAIEIAVETDTDAIAQLATTLPTAQQRLAHCHAALADLEALTISPSVAGLCELIVHSGLALQRHAGHAVECGGVATNAAGDRFYAWFEYEEPGTAEAAAELACRLVEAAVRCDPAALLVELAGTADHFTNTAASCALPHDSWAILRAASQRGIPVLHMDRPPFEPIEGPFRVRPNGLLRLGHGAHRETVDGTLCVSRNEGLHRLLKDRAALLDRLTQAAIPTLVDPPGSWCAGASQAARRAERLGYPVTLYAAVRGVAAEGPLHARESVRDAAQRMLQRGAEAVLPVATSSGAHRVVLCAGERSYTYLAPVAAVVTNNPAAWLIDEAPAAALTALAQQVAQTLACGLLAVSAIAVPPQGEGAAAAWRVVDVDIAPQLHHYLPLGPLLDRLAAAFVDWLFPDPSLARIPIIAVTGTNGKTTTSFLLERILTAAGHRTGLASSVGRRIGGAMVSDEEEAYALGHTRVLNDPTITAAVLESTRAAAAGAGLGFARCDVAICLNVTADHLNDELETRTVADLAAAKYSIVARADQAVVLNADDALCRGMLAALPGRRIGLVTAGDPADLAREAAASAGLVHREGRVWLAIQQAGMQLPVLAVEEIPIAYQGRAQHNVSNALHAALAAFLLGISIEHIAVGLRDLQPHHAVTPGRMNEFGGFAFTVYLDYAHNPAGVAAISAFARATTTARRRILCFSCSNHNSDDLIRATGAAAAGAFDLYICKNFGKLFDRSPAEGPGLLRAGLLEAGVPSAAIQCVEDELEAIDATLALAQPGDLVIIIGGKRHQLIAQHIQRRAQHGEEASLDRIEAQHNRHGLPN